MLSIRWEVLVMVQTVTAPIVYLHAVFMQSSAAYNSVFKWIFPAIFRWIFTSSLYQQSGLQLIQNRTLHVLNTQQLQSLFMQQASNAFGKIEDTTLHTSCKLQHFNFSNGKETPQIQMQ